MWLPSRLYESLPWAYALIGALFIGGVYYVGVHRYGMLVYLALGLICVVCGLLVHRVRVNMRKNAAAEHDLAAE